MATHIDADPNGDEADKAWLEKILAERQQERRLVCGTVLVQAGLITPKEITAEELEAALRRQKPGEPLFL